MRWWYEKCTERYCDILYTVHILFSQYIQRSNHPQHHVAIQQSSTHVREGPHDGFRWLRKPGENESCNECNIIQAQKVVDTQSEHCFHSRVTWDDCCKCTIAHHADAVAVATIHQAQLTFVHVEPVRWGCRCGCCGHLQACEWCIITNTEMTSQWISYGRATACIVVIVTLQLCCGG